MQRELRYCHEVGLLACNGTAPDGSFEKTLTRFRPGAHRLPANSPTRATRSDRQRKIASANTVAAIEKLARSDRRHATTVDIWDADPWLLNTPGGIVDLHTGKMLPHDPEQYITKITAVAPERRLPALAPVPR